MNTEDIKEDIKNENVEEVTEKAVEETPQNNENNAEYEAKILKLEQELAAQKNLFLRTAAEYENFRKRTEKEKLGIYADAMANAIKNLLPVADSITIALASMNDVPAEYKKGVELINNQLKSAFQKLKVEEFGEIGEEFNPDIHNAIAHIDDEQLGENVISQVFQKGYKSDDKIIRHAMVQVAN